MDKNIRNLLLAATAAACAIPSVATAAQGDWLIRAGVGMVAPTGDLSVTIDGGEAGSFTAKIEADDATSFVFDVTWMATDNLGIELLAAWPFEHDVVVRADGESASPWSVEQLPPTLSVQWHFMPDAKVRPYVGAGISYVMFSGEKNKYPEDFDPIRIGDEFTWSVQAGMDIALGDTWFVNLAIRYIDLTVTVESYDEGGVYEKLDLPVDPFVYALNIGRKF